MSLRLFWGSGWNLSLPNIWWVEGCSAETDRVLAGGVSPPSPLLPPSISPSSPTSFQTLQSRPPSLLSLPHSCSRLSDFFGPTNKTYVMECTGETKWVALVDLSQSRWAPWWPWKSQIWDKEQSTFEVVLFFGGVDTTRLLPLTPVQCQSDVSIKQSVFQKTFFSLVSPPI